MENRLGLAGLCLYGPGIENAAADMLHDLILRRGESVRGQLTGAIPSTEDGQRADPAPLIDASGIDIGVMGSFMFGGFNRSASDEMARDDASSEASGELASAGPGAASEEQEAAESGSGRRSSGEMLAASREMMRASAEMAAKEQRDTVFKNALTYGGLLALMAAAFVLVRLYARRFSKA